MKRLISTLCLFAVLAVASAQEARTLFVHMPDSILPLLTPVNRADCIDFLDSRMRAVVTNRLGGKSEMLTLTPDYIRLQMTPKSTWQMRLLPLTDSTQVICTVSTVYGPAPDCTIRFYDTDWHFLPAVSYLPVLPQVEDFLLDMPDSACNYRLRDVRRQADLRLLDATLTATGDSLVFRLGTPSYMEREAAEELKPFIRRSIPYLWRDGQFHPVVRQ